MIRWLREHVFNRRATDDELERRAQLEALRVRAGKVQERNDAALEQRDSLAETLRGTVAGVRADQRRQRGHGHR